ncbi:MAG: cobD [Actinomycetia bacterium]|nr:cobD [Actinomycetes bacterium]
MSSRALRRRCGAVAAGLLGDRVAGEPPAALHPVAAFGTAMGRVEHAVYDDTIAAGARYALTGIAIGAIAGTIARSTALAVSVAVAGRALRATALDVHDALERRDLGQARSLLPALVGRDPSELDESGVAAAVIESVAENSVDAVIAPSLWAVGAGAPGALGYRAVNTMDAMVGHRSERYTRFGAWSARADDIANWIPARLTVLLVLAARPRRASSIWRAVRADAPAHPSPNAGVAEAAFAGALGLQLGGPLRYGERFEQRPLLGTGPRPRRADITRAVRLASDVELLLAGALGAVACSGRTP